MHILIIGDQYRIVMLIICYACICLLFEKDERYFNQVAAKRHVL